MKYYATDSSVTFHSYTVNFGEVIFQPELDDVLEKFSKFIGKPKASVDLVYFDLTHRALAEKKHGSSFLANAKGEWTPNEWSLLLQLANFIDFVDASIADAGRVTDSRVLHFCDLNTGYSLTWSHTVC